MNNLKYFFLVFALISTSATYTMKRKANSSLGDPARFYKRARTTDIIGHELWYINTRNNYELFNQKLNTELNTIKEQLSFNSEITHAGTTEELLREIKNNKNLKKTYSQQYLNLKCLNIGTNGAQQTVETLQALRGTQVFTASIYAILTNEFSKPRDQLPSAFQQALYIIESAIKEFYDTHLASSNNHQTFNQLLINYNNDFGTTLYNIQQTAVTLLLNRTIQQPQYRYLLDLACGYHGVLDAIETESKLHNESPEIKEKK